MVAHHLIWVVEKGRRLGGLFRYELGTGYTMRHATAKYAAIVGIPTLNNRAVQKSPWSARIHLGIETVDSCLEFVLCAEADDLALVRNALFEFFVVGLRVALGLGYQRTRPFLEDRRAVGSRVPRSGALVTDSSHT